MKAVVAAFNQEKALVEAFSIIVKTGCGTDEALYYTLHSTSCGCVRDTGARRAGNCEQSVGGELPHGRSSTIKIIGHWQLIFVCKNRPRNGNVR